MIGKEKQLPSEHQASREADEKAVAQAIVVRKKEEARVLQAFDKVLKTEEGKVVWKWLFDRCGYNKGTLVRGANADISQISSECYSAVRGVYIDLRKMASMEALVDAELYAEYGIMGAGSNVKTEDEKGEK